MGLFEAEVARACDAAAGKLDALFDHPDDVAGEGGNLFFAQCDAGAQVELFGGVEAAVHEGLVLVVGAGVVTHEPSSGEFGDLVVDEFLFVEAVA